MAKNVPMNIKLKSLKLNSKRIWSVESKAKSFLLIIKAKYCQRHKDKRWDHQEHGVRNPNYGKPAAHGKGEYYTKKDGNIIWLRSYWNK